MQIYGRELNWQAIRELTGDPSQLAGVTPIEYTEGSARGTRALEVRTGSGLRFTVELDRGMDIGECELRGIPIGWRTGAGPVHPSFYEPHGDEWLRTYAVGADDARRLDTDGQSLRRRGRGARGAWASRPRERA